MLLNMRCYRHSMRSIAETGNLIYLETIFKIPDKFPFLFFSEKLVKILRNDGLLEAEREI